MSVLGAHTRDRCLGIDASGEGSTGRPRLLAGLDGVQRSKAAILVVLIALGVVIRIVLIATSFGSNDMEMWTIYAERVRTAGLWQLYRDISIFNHPPLMGWMAGGLHWLAERISVPFATLFKLPMLGTDLLALGVLWAALRERGTLVALAAMAAFSCNPVSILITGFHGNTDSLCAVLVLVAAYLHHRGRPLASGLAIAAAANVKIIALLCIPVMVLLLRDRRALGRFVAGGMIGAVPFAVALGGAGRVFVENVFGYGGFIERWGISTLGMEADSVPVVKALVVDGYGTFGRTLVVLAVFVVAGLARRRGWTVNEGVAAALVCFLVLTPAWGIQYLVWPVPILAAVSLKSSVRYALPAGIYAIGTYLSYVVDWSPIRTIHRGRIPAPWWVFGLFAWGILVLYLWRAVRARPSSAIDVVAESWPMQIAPARH